MSSPGRHASASTLWCPTRLGVTTAVAALVAVTVIIAAVAANSTGPRSVSAARPAPSAQPANTGPANTGPANTAPANTGPVARANAVPALTGRGHQPDGAPSVAAPAHRATMPLVLTAADHQDCPAAAAACVDLTRHITWLQGNGRITFGPVRMEPGKPGSGHQTPRGTFHVQWKAGPSYVSNIYDEPMPWATFFASGGIAFHGGSLTAWSHGCVHLTNQSAHYYNERLPIGAEVVVF
jgi:lipoprotein-anchoring transpeptidase ErfK/SrfK